MKGGGGEGREISHKRVKGGGGVGGRHKERERAHESTKGKSTGYLRPCYKDQTETETERETEGQRERKREREKQGQRHRDRCRDRDSDRRRHRCSCRQKTTTPCPSSAPSKEHTNMDSHRLTWTHMYTRRHTWTHIEPHGHTHTCTRIHSRTHTHAYAHTWETPSEDILEPDPNQEIAQPFKRSPKEYDSATLWNSSFLSVSVGRERERGRDVCVIETNARKRAIKLTV